MCGATLIHANFILTDIECAIKCVGHVDPYVTVMLGQDERSEVGLSSQVVLATLKHLKFSFDFVVLNNCYYIPVIDPSL